MMKPMTACDRRPTIWKGITLVPSHICVSTMQTYHGVLRAEDVYDEGTSNGTGDVEQASVTVSSVHNASGQNRRT